MSENLSAVTGSKEEVWTREGKNLILRPLKMKQWGSMLDWVKRKVVSEAQNLCEGVPSEYHAGIWERAIAKAEAVDISSEQFTIWMSSPEGAAMLLWLSAQRAHPELTYDEAAGLIGLEDVEEFQMAFFRVNGAALHPGLDVTSEESLEEHPTLRPSPRSGTGRPSSASSRGRTRPTSRRSGS